MSNENKHNGNRKIYVNLNLGNVYLNNTNK